MTRSLTMEFWLDEGWYVGTLLEVPGVFSQGETLAQLEDNIRDAYELVLEDQREARGTPQPEPMGRWVARVNELKRPSEYSVPRRTARSCCAEQFTLVCQSCLDCKGKLRVLGTYLVFPFRFLGLPPV